MPLKCYKEGLVFLVAKTLKDIINHSLTGPLEALYWGVWGGVEKSQSQQKLALEITTHFTIQFHSKNLIHLTNFDSLVIVKSILPQHS